MNKTIFTKNDVNSKILVERKFNAPLPLVWKAWTDSEILDQWWAPRPWRMETKNMDFTEGGQWLYSMVSPEGERHWCKVNYKSIDTEQFFISQGGFCDEAGNITNELPEMKWHVSFIKAESSTIVKVDIDFLSIEEMHTIVEMGFKEGFSMAHENLDALLSKVSV